jgi:hypothetical protein
VREQGGKVGIGFFVVNDEPCIDRDRSTSAAGDPDGAAMPTHAAIALINRDIVPLAQQPSRRQAGNASADDRNFQLLTIAATHLYSRPGQNSLLTGVQGATRGNRFWITCRTKPLIQVVSGLVWAGYGA